MHEIHYRIPIENFEPSEKKSKVLSVTVWFYDMVYFHFMPYLAMYFSYYMVD